MDSLQTSLLAVIQGITELIPISSTGHVLLFSKLFLHVDPTILLLTLLQFGTTLSIIFAFKDYLFKDIFKREKLFLYFKLILATIPSVIVVLIFERQIETLLYNNEIITVSLFFWGVIMILVENKRFNKDEVTKLEDVSMPQAIGVGIAQSLAIIPGTSRSGVTTVAGVMLGIEKFTALKFSFLLGLPVLLGSFVFEMYRYKDDLSGVFTATNILGILISFIVGLLAVKVLSRYSKKKFLTFFGVYRIILAIILFLFVI